MIRWLPTTLDLRFAGHGVDLQAFEEGVIGTIATSDFVLLTVQEFHDVMGVDRKKIASSLWMSAGFVVDASLRGLESNSLYVIPGWRYKLLVAILTKLPSGLRTWAESRNPQSRDRYSNDILLPPTMQ